VIVIKHRNETFKSTPFQVVFSEKALKIRESKKNKSKELQFFVNEELIDLPLRIDPSNGRIQFQKVMS
jgi:phosphatidate phosphatase PAH1